MQQEDDLRGLARVMDFMRAISILFTVINVYWFCYSSLKDWGITIGVVDKILLNFQRTTGLFSTILWTKLFAVVFLALSCIGTKGVKEEKITWTKIYCFLSVGFILFFLNWWLLDLPLPPVANTAFYITTLAAGFLCLLVAGIWMSRLLKSNLMEDVFNTENVIRAKRFAPPCKNEMCFFTQKRNAIKKAANEVSNEKHLPLFLCVK